MLGLIFGTRAGERTFELLEVMLPRFLLPLPFLLFFLSPSIADGVLAGTGDSAKMGLCAIEPGLADAGVLNGPSLGVLRADDCDVLSSEVMICVLICESDGFRPLRLAAASGKDRSSSLGHD